MSFLSFSIHYSRYLHNAGTRPSHILFNILEKFFIFKWDDKQLSSASAFICRFTALIFFRCFISQARQHFKSWHAIAEGWFEGFFLPRGIGSCILNWIKNPFFIFEKIKMYKAQRIQNPLYTFWDDSV